MYFYRFRIYFQVNHMRFMSYLTNVTYVMHVIIEKLMYTNFITSTYNILYYIYK